MWRQLKRQILFTAKMCCPTGPVSSGDPVTKPSDRRGGPDMVRDHCAAQAFSPSLCQNIHSTVVQTSPHHRHLLVYPTLQHSNAVGACGDSPRQRSGKRAHSKLLRLAVQEAAAEAWCHTSAGEHARYGQCSWAGFDSCDSCTPTGAHTFKCVSCAAVAADPLYAREKVWVPFMKKDLACGPDTIIVVRVTTAMSL